MPHGLVKVEDIPTVFQDSLELRAKNIRFRGVGNPYAFLDGIGIIPIKEYLFRGANIIDVADTLNVPITLINNWIERNNFYSDIEEASVLSAEGYIYRGEKLLTEAENKFQLDKAKAMLEHGRFMASKKDRKQYGTPNETAPAGGGATYIFNIGKPPEQETPQATIMGEILDAEFTAQEPLTMALDFGIDRIPLPRHLEGKGNTHIKPTPEPTETVGEMDKWDF